MTMDGQVFYLQHVKEVWHTLYSHACHILPHYEYNEKCP